MSQQKQTSQRPQEGGQNVEQEPIKYGTVFAVSGELASETVAPTDAAMMQSAESIVFGETQKGGPAAAMQAAATVNERSGFVRHDGVSDAAKKMGVTITETDLCGSRVITESVGGQVVGQFEQANKGGLATRLTQLKQQSGGSAKITIGEALEAVAATTGDKPVEQSDAAAIQAAEVRATGSNVILPGSLTSSAQSAASTNAHIDRDENKIKLGVILANATMKLTEDKEVTRQDAEGVVSAELRNNANVATHPAGVAASIAAAARLNEGSTA